MASRLEEQYTFNREKPTAVITELIDVVDAVARARALVGGMQYINGVLQMVFPDRDTMTGLFCNDVSLSLNWEGKGEAHAGLAKLTATYGIPEFSDDDTVTEFGSTSIKIGGEIIQMGDGTDFQWSEGAKYSSTPLAARLRSRDVKPTKRDPIADVSVTFNLKPRIAVAALFQKIGKINNAPFGFPGISDLADSACCLFNGVDTERKFTSEGNEYWKETFNFLVKGHSWNKYWDGLQWSAVNKQTYEFTSFAGIYDL